MHKFFYIKSDKAALKNDAAEDITQTFYLGVRARGILENDKTDPYSGLSGHFGEPLFYSCILCSAGYQTSHVKYTVHVIYWGHHGNKESIQTKFCTLKSCLQNWGILVKVLHENESIIKLRKLDGQ